jgi:PTH1 family peptidyl-tRNA hydrolase
MGYLAVERYLESRQGIERLECSEAEVYRLGDFLIAKPLTYMNLSGLAVKEISERFGLAPQRMLIVHDDVALPFGIMRARAKGGSGGHHGMESILEALGTEEIPRLRLGIGKEELPQDLTGYVLGEFTPAERSKLDEFLKRAADAIDCFFRHGIEAVMDQFNS